MRAKPDMKAKLTWFLLCVPLVVATAALTAGIFLTYLDPRGAWPAMILFAGIYLAIHVICSIVWLFE